MALLSKEEIGKRMEQLSGRWRHESNAIHKDFTNEDFVGSIQFVNRVVEPAEEMGHHPDLRVSWDTVTVSITTHSEGGLTDADFELATRIDALA
jgi:4a-hydroxytetrahydrobiopterin dehydratase